MSSKYLILLLFLVLFSCRVLSEPATKKRIIRLEANVEGSEPISNNSHEISTSQYIFGGVLSIVPGFGLGHAVQKRYSEKGKFFTNTELASAAVFGISVFLAKQCHHEWSCFMYAIPGILSAGAYVAVKFLEITDAWVGPLVEKKRAAEVENPRLEYRWGIYTSFLGDPVLGVPGINVGWTATDFMRLSLGGSVLTPQLGGGVRFYIPSLHFSPTVGVNMAYLFTIKSQQEEKGPILGLNVGCEVMNYSGINVGAGLGKFRILRDGTTSGLWPYVHLGVFW